jgi:hypothetical protein
MDDSAWAGLVPVARAWNALLLDQFNRVSRIRSLGPSLALAA